MFANATQGVIEGQHGIRGQAALDGCGFGNAPVFNVENACASASTALHLAHVIVGSGGYDCVLAIGAEKMATPDPATSMAAFEGSWDLSPSRQRRSPNCWRWGAAWRSAGSGSGGPHSVFMDVYAAFCRHHMAKFGTTQRQMAAVSAKNHRHSVENPRAQYRRRLYGRGGAGRAADRLAADAADVQPDQRRRRGRARLHAGIRAAARAGRRAVASARA